MEIILGELADWFARMFCGRPVLRFLALAGVFGLGVALVYVEWFG